MHLISGQRAQPGACGNIDTDVGVGDRGVEVSDAYSSGWLWIQPALGSSVWNSRRDSSGERHGPGWAGTWT